MEDEEVEFLIATLSEIVRDSGFSWVSEDLEETTSLEEPRDRRALATALLDGIEAATAGLASVEAATLERLGVEEVLFKSEGGAFIGDVSPPRGDARLNAIGRAIAGAEAIEQLRRALNGD